VIPPFEPTTGNLPAGIHASTWEEIVARFGNTPHRYELLAGLLRALLLLREAGCETFYLDGSFVTSKEVPLDYDGCWRTEGVDFDRLDERLLTFDAGRKTQKAAFNGEMFLADVNADPHGTLFLDFFQRDRDGRAKGIIVIDLKGLP
jgi:hypothetical protein